ncbi:MAG: hypothetical protein JXQ27_15880 [Acidobacteria bacterium]|nr:hypothetical protein [Acidobacteriota bacterium]
MKINRFPAWLIFGLIWLMGVGLTSVFGEEMQSPESYFGFRPGADRELMDYDQLIDYLQKLDAASDRMTMMTVGSTPLGKPMYLAFFSAPDNLARLAELKEINRRLALEADLTPEQRDELVALGRVFAFATLSMHSSEVGPSQMLPLFAWEMATTTDETVLRQLQAVVFMVVPSHNPDGMDMVVGNYREYKGTKYEGSGLPGVYHKYVGHDNNRDFVALTQADTRVINRIYSTEWYPQVLVEKHQMGSTGPRYFVPPNHDPIAQVIDEGLWHWSALFGANLSRDMGAAGLSGVAHSWVFDNYWPGSTETSLWKNVISFLTECASCRTATPVYVEPNELQTRGKGLADYKKSANMPAPWPGGWWRLSDIVEYELVTMRSILRTAATYHEDILRYRNDLCREEVERGRTEAPYYFMLPRRQHDPAALLGMVRLLQEHGVQLFQLRSDVELDRTLYRSGDLVVPLAQPYRAFVKEVMEDQEYPVRRYTPDGEVIRPYDVTSWSLPLHHGVHSIQVDTRSAALESAWEPLADVDELLPPRAVVDTTTWAVACSADSNATFRLVFQALYNGFTVERLLESMDAGSVSLPAGSFLIFPAGGKSDLLNGWLGEFSGEAVLLTDEPDTRRQAVAPRRIALVETHLHDMDAGWTRFLLDTYGIPFTVVHPGEFEKTDFRTDFDVILLPSSDKNVLLKGTYGEGERYWVPDYPPQYTQGMGDKGMENLLKFIDQGGLVVSWGGSTDLFMGPLKITHDKENVETFRMPVRNVADNLKKQGLLVPGAGLRIKVVTGHPLTWGLAAESFVFSRGEPVFQTSIPSMDMDRRVLATYTQKDILASGYIEKEGLLADKTVLTWLRKNKGQLVLMGFQPQFRASTPVSYKFLFNAILLPPLP